MRSMMKARNLVRTFKPHVAVGVGGYASGPLLAAAQRMNVPTLIQEQNSFPGRTNIYLAKPRGTHLRGLCRHGASSSPRRRYC
jgi:UDP-N-acetylglucosamine:LPS N-acetylglucosamine transferase